MYEFKKDLSYKFGILNVDGERNPDSPNPEFMKNPGPVVMAGFQLLDMGFKNFYDYLKENPHKYPARKTVSCYIWRQNGANGQFELFAQGNPLPENYQNSTSNQTNLSDNLRDQTRPIILDNSKNHADYKTVIEMLNNQIDILNNEIQLKNVKISELTEKILKKDEEMSSLNVAKRTAEMENEWIKGKMKKNIEESNDSPSLGDKLADGFSTAMQNPMIQNSVGMILMGLAKKFGMGGDDIVGTPNAGVIPTGPPQPQQPAQRTNGTAQNQYMGEPDYENL